MWSSRSRACPSTVLGEARASTSPHPQPERSLHTQKGLPNTLEATRMSRRMWARARMRQGQGGLPGAQSARKGSSGLERTAKLSEASEGRFGLKELSGVPSHSPGSWAWHPMGEVQLEKGTQSLLERLPLQTSRVGTFQGRARGPRQSPRPDSWSDGTQLPGLHSRAEVLGTEPSSDTSCDTSFF